jgi:2-dehydropantoate 2-reductase
VARPAHVEAIRARGLLFESAGRVETVRVDAHASPDAVAGADLVLFCVKTRDTESGAREVASRLRPGAVVVSLQNGVDNVARMRAAAGLDPIAAVVYVACSMAAPGHVLHAGRGDLVLGEVAPAALDAVRSSAVEAQRAPGGAVQCAAGVAAQRVAEVAAVFERAGVPCPVSADVRVDLWVKLVMNCVFNAISALGRSHYGRMIADPGIRALTRDVVDECVAVARADGVPLADAGELHASAMTLGRAMAPATSSTAQDLAAGRSTEIDSLNGYVAARGAALGVATPVNRALHALVRLMEQSLQDRPR